MAKFILDPCVEDELWSIWEFIAKDNPDAATAVVEATHETIRMLAAQPEMGVLRKFKSSKLANMRSFRVSDFQNSLIFYRPVEDGIQVLHVFHGARDLEALFEI